MYGLTLQYSYLHLSTLFDISDNMIELARELGLLSPKTLPSAYHTEGIKWEPAFLGTNMFQREVYLASLALQGATPKRAYAFMITNGYSTSIDVPLIDPTPDDRLAQQAYETTFFGEVDPERYRTFATNEFTREHLLASLNRTQAGVSPDEVHTWFYTTFGVEHLGRYGSVYIGSHGGRDSFNATIESIPHANTSEGNATRAAAQFADFVERSIPQLSVEPLPVETYLQDIQNTLKFLPRDWRV